MNLQKQVTALMFAENNRVLSRVKPRLFALSEGDTVELSTVMERSLSGQAFPGRKSSSVLLSLRWWADIQAEISARHAEMCVETCVSEGGGRRKVGYFLSGAREKGFGFSFTCSVVLLYYIIYDAFCVRSSCELI